MRPLAAVVFGLPVAAAVAGLMAFAVPKPAGALPSYSKETGLSCGRCHTNPAGGGKLTAFGSDFAANDHKVPQKKNEAGKDSSKEEDKDSSIQEDFKKGESSKEGKSEEKSKEQVSDGTSPATESKLDLESGRALDYVPWTLRDPYHSHFLYKSDDYRD